MDAVAIPQGVPISAWIVSVIIATAFIVRYALPFFKKNKLEDANSNAQINVIDMLQAQLRAAFDRVAMAEKSRDDAVSLVTNLKLELGALKVQLLTLERDLERTQKVLTKGLDDATK